MSNLSPMTRTLLIILVFTALLAGGSGCSTLRTTDPPQTATEQFLMTIAAAEAVDRLNFEALRGRRVYFDDQFVDTSQKKFLVAEVRAKALRDGAQIVRNISDAEAIVEIRSAGVGIDRYEFLLGIPAIFLTQATSGTSGSSAPPLVTPELAIVKNIEQRGFASIAYVAYWNNTGELVASSGPFVGRTLREDWWILGYGPRTVGDIPPAQRNENASE
jgi:hypothetical protein